MKKIIGLIAFLLVQPVFAQGVQTNYESRCLVVVGTASTEGVSEEFARRMAIRNALKLASMQSNLKISSSQEMNNFMLTKDAVRFSSQSKVTKFKILSEGFKEPDFDAGFDKDGMPIELPEPNIYQVSLNVCLTEDPAACENVLGNSLQPKLAIAQVVTTDQAGASDISNLTAGFQLELQRRLKLKGYNNLVLLHSGGRLQETTQLVVPSLIRNKLAPIAEETGAQYLLLNVIRSISKQIETGSWNSVKRFYNQEIKPSQRFIEVDSYIVDLTTQKIVYEKRHGFDIEGDVFVGRDRPFGSNAFFATDTGMVFNALLEQEVKSAYQFLKCKPLKSQIIDIRNGDYIIFLSAESGAKVGDELTVYHKFGRPVMQAGINLGLDSKPTGFLRITRIQSKFAVAEMLSKEGMIQVGDEVRTW